MPPIPHCCRAAACAAPSTGQAGLPLKRHAALSGLKKAIALFVVFNVLYMLALKFVYPLLV